jgi:uncharacterized membrane protein YphA (DoxX/SURF4 family)
MRRTGRFYSWRDADAAVSPLYGSGRVRAVPLVMLRAMLAVAFIGHGSQNLFARFGGLGVDRTARYFESVGLSPGRPLTLLGLGERRSRRRACLVGRGGIHG